jgi:hypothetical protein
MLSCHFNSIQAKIHFVTLNQEELYKLLLIKHYNNAFFTNLLIMNHLKKISVSGSSHLRRKERGISIFPDLAALSVSSSASTSKNPNPKDPLESVLNGDVVSNGEILSNGDAAMSRDQVLQDILKSRNPNREIHVEDFLWTGSGKGFFQDTLFLHKYYYKKT